MRLTRYGAREWISATIACAVIGILAIVLGWWWVLVVAIIAWFVVAAFFRDPLGRRPSSEHEHDWLSPADGKISAIETVQDHEATGGPALIVRIFLSVLDVHVNRAPCTATVREIRYRPGLWLDARTEESARVNESNLIMLETPEGAHLGVRQVSGAIARRIVCPLEPGDVLQRGNRFGMIKFGSTTELIIPDPELAKVQVAVGDKVRAGITILASLECAATEARTGAEAQAASGPSPKPQSLPSS